MRSGEEIMMRLTLTDMAGRGREEVAASAEAVVTSVVGGKVHHERKSRAGRITSTFRLLLSIIRLKEWW